GTSEPERGNAALIWERGRLPADRSGRLLGEKHMAEKRPKPQQSEREHEQVAEQPIDDEAAVDWPRPFPYRNGRRSLRPEPKQNRNERDLRHKCPLLLAGRFLVHGLKLVDQAFDDLEPHRPEIRVGGVEAEWREQLLVVLSAPGREHVEIALGETFLRLLVNGVERIHQAIAEGIGIDVERRVDKVRNVAPEGFVTGLQLDRRSETLLLHFKPDLAKPPARQLAVAPLGVHLPLEAIKGDLPHHRVDHVLDLRREESFAL